MKHCLFFLLLTACSLTGQAQAVRDTAVFYVMSYNVENLFNCRHDSLKDDYEFLPDATRHWTPYRYWKKLDNIARVIRAVGGWELPALVALCEVENDSVLFDLTCRSILRKSTYRYLITNSEDERGIDVALLYQRELFKPLQTRHIRIKKPRKDSRPTRDILHVTGKILSMDTLDVLVAHLPSRTGGAKQSDAYRQMAAEQIRAITDSLAQVRERAQIIVMGDFNDYPNSRLIQETLGAEKPPMTSTQADSRKLYHLLAEQAETQRHQGSYKYKGVWQWLDHILVNGNLLKEDTPFHLSEAQAGVFAPPFLLTEDLQFGGVKPLRTYHGMKYQDGYSDHLPVYARFIVIY